MSLRAKQSRFARLVVKLLQKMTADGYEYTLGEVFRSDEQCEINAIRETGRGRVAQLIMEEFPALAKALLNNGEANGIRISIHGLKLAIDINLFKDGVLLSTTESHRVFGEWWEKQDPDARWGGRFRDGNHYSFEHNGIK